MNQVFAEPTKLVLVYVTVVCLCEGHSEFQIRRLWTTEKEVTGWLVAALRTAAMGSSVSNSCLRMGMTTKARTQGGGRYADEVSKADQMEAGGAHEMATGDQQQTRRKLQWPWRASEVPRERAMLDRVLAVPRTNGSILSKGNSKAFFPGLSVNADSVCGKCPLTPFPAPRLTAWKLFPTDTAPTNISQTRLLI